MSNDKSKEQCKCLMVVRKFKRDAPDDPLAPETWWECVECKRQFVPRDGSVDSRTREYHV